MSHLVMKFNDNGNYRKYITPLLSSNF